MYSNGIVLMKFPKAGQGGWVNIGKNKKKYQLPEPYRLLNIDNSISKKIYYIELGNAEGAILLK